MPPSVLQPPPSPSALLATSPPTGQYSSNLSQQRSKSLLRPTDGVILVNGVTAAEPSAASHGLSSPARSRRSSEARSSLLRLTRRHSLPASYHLTTFLSLFNGQGAAENASTVPDHSSSAGLINGDSNRTIQQRGPAPPADAPATFSLNNTKTTTPTAASVTGSITSASTTPNSASVNRHRYGHRHTKSAAVLDQPVVVNTYNPPSTPRMLGRTGMINPAIYEEDETPKVDLPPIDAFSFNGVLKAVDPEVTQTVNRVSYLCSRLREDIKAEVETLSQTQKEILLQKQQADRLAAQALKTTNARCDALTAESSGLKGGAAVDDLAQLAESAYTTLGSIVSTLLAIDDLLPPQERLAPDNSLHRLHYPQVHHLLNKKHHEVTARFGNSAIAAGKGTDGARGIPRITKRNPSPPSSPQLSASLPNPTHQEPGWLRRRMSSSSTMLLNSQYASLEEEEDDDKRMSLPPQLQLKTILPTPSATQSPTNNSSQYARRGSTPGLSTMRTPTSASLQQRRQTANPLPTPKGLDRKYSFANDEHSENSRSGRRSSGNSSGNLFGGSWRGTGKWAFLGGNSGNGSSESERTGNSAADKLKRVLGSAGKGKSIDRSG